MSDSRDSSAGSSQATELSYFRRLEELFIGLRGAPLLLSPADWDTARSWRTQGIPFDLIERVLREIFESSPEKRGRSGVRSLKYFDSAVTRAWEEARGLGIAGDDAGRDGEPIDIEERIGALAAALPSSIPEAAGIESRLEALEGTAEQIERQLAELDDELMKAIEKTLTVAERRAIEADVGAALDRLGSRIEDDQRARIRIHLRSRQLRRLKGLPILSLFASPGSRAVDDD